MNLFSNLTPEELAEIEQFDRECEQAPLTVEERRAARERDLYAISQMAGAERAELSERETDESKRERWRDYYRANQLRYAEKRKVWRKNNRLRVLEYSKRYFAKHKCEANQQLRVYRLRQGLSQRCLAERLGVSQTLVSWWELGRTETPEWIKKIIEE